MKYKHLEHDLPDKNQNVFQLAVIQLSGFISLPLLASSVFIYQETNLADAIITIIISNLLLWFFRYYIIFIGFKGRKSTLDIASDHVGKVGRYFVAIALLLSTLAWYIAQTTLASNAITNLLHFKLNHDVDHLIQVSVVLGVVSTLLCQEGIIVVRWVSTLAFPLLIGVFLGLLLTTPVSLSSFEWSKITLKWLPLEIGTNLGVTADLPTFFRHSKSWKTSLKALTIIQIFTLFISLTGLFLGPVVSPWLEGNTQEYIASSALQSIFLIILIFFSVICANISNVYSASVGWEIVAPTLAGRKEYLILGLGLTTIFILISNIFSMHYLLETTDTALINLCFIVIIAYFIHRLKKTMPTPFEQVVYFLAWLSATALNIFQVLHFIIPHHSILIMGPLIMLMVIGLGMGIHLLISRKA